MLVTSSERAFVYKHKSSIRLGWYRPLLNILDRVYDIALQSQQIR
jgi:hypothetical protein